MTGGNWSTRTAALVGAVLAVVLVAGSALVAPTAGAAAQDRRKPGKVPQVQLTIDKKNRDIDAGTPFEVRVTSKALGKAKVLLQRRAAGTRNWVKAARIGKRGTFKAPGVEIGVYTYRAVAKKHGKVIAKSKGQQLRSYGDLPLTTFCGGGAATVRTCASGTTPFGLAYNAVSNGGPGAAPGAESTNSSCGAISIRFGATDAPSSVSLTQDKGGAPQTATAAVGTAGAATLKIGSKGWQLQFLGSSQIYWDATLHCFTTNGVRK